MSEPVLSVCIPTYNRRDMIVELVNDLLQQPGSFELCVHDDGSVDGTYEALQRLSDVRLKITRSANRGRASALVAACGQATGRFVMVFDDDDKFLEGGIASVVIDCEMEIPEGVIGYIYHLADENGDFVGGGFPVHKSNFLRIRADEHVVGDKKEVVLRAALAPLLSDLFGVHRRVPTSLYWARLAQEHDVICINRAIGTKRYLVGGMTHRAKWLKLENARPMMHLYYYRFWGYVNGRYSSFGFASASLAAFSFYGLLAFWQSLARRVMTRTLGK